MISETKLSKELNFNQFTVNASELTVYWLKLLKIYVKFTWFILDLI